MSTSESSNPIPVNCPLCGEPMNFSGAGTVRDELCRSERIREYICFEHGYYHLGERKALTGAVATPTEEITL